MNASRNNSIARVVVAVVIVLVALGNIPLIRAATMTSSSYKIQRDSVNVGGGLNSSANYISENTAGEVGTGDSASTNYKIRAGYQQMPEVYLSVTAASDVVMSPNLGGVTGGTSNGSTALTVTTDDAAGYQLSIKASSTPALQGNNYGASIADYTPAGAAPDFAFSVPAADAEFGFSPEGTDIVAKYKDNGASCNTGSGDTASACWDALSTSNQIISSAAAANTPGGTATTIRFRATLGSSHITIADTYTATTTLTAVAL